MHSFVSCLMHCVFSTKERRRLITPEIQQRLYPYLGGIARENKMKAYLSAESKITFMRCYRFPQRFQLPRRCSYSRGILQSGFMRQEGYGAFSIAVSGIEDTIGYIQSQKEHHKVHSFKDELIAFLEKHGIECKQWMLA